jgi:demethylmenaquinone methyltransferase/2-methoxy-6-polyprenyl-1,4-benzoquinol methylase
MTVDKSGARVKQMFGEIAPNYDRMNHLLSMNVDRYWRWWTVRKVRPVAEIPILDLCTGTGDLAFAFHRYTRGRAPIVAADFCPEMLAIGEQKKQRLGLQGELEFREADAENLPFENERFQVVSVAFGLRNVSDTDRGVREMIRVLRPGGKLAVLEFSHPTWQPFKAIYGWYFRNILPRLGQLFAKNKSEAYKYLPESVGEFPCGQALADRLKACGLSSVQYYPLTFGIATLYLGVK